MKTLNVVQGSDEWLGLRANYFTASEAPAMMGASKYQTRDELLALKKYGIAKKIDSHTQKLFDRGHKTEADIRPFIEKIVGDDLYPVTGVDEVDGISLLVSFDGLTMGEDIVFEHKLWSQSLAEQVKSGELEPHYYWQLEQQLLISGAEKAIFVTSDGTEQKMVYFSYYPVPGRREELLAGWAQFAKDLKTYEYVEDTPKPEAAVIDSLPALNVQVEGKVLATNIQQYESSAMAFIDSISTDLETDQDFANAENQVKFCSDVESQLKAVKQHVLSQTADIDAVFSCIDSITERMRLKRLDLGKLVTAKKLSIKTKLVDNARKAVGEYQDKLAESIGGDFLTHTGNFQDVIKNKRTLTSIQSALNDELARVKIELTEKSQTVLANQKYLREVGEYNFLFNDYSTVITKENDDFKLLVDSRISKYKEDQEKTKQQEAKSESGLSPEAQEFVDEMDNTPPTSIQQTAPPKPIELSKAEQKKRDADIKKVKAYVARLTSYKVPEVTDEKCSEILAVIVNWLGGAENRVSEVFPEKQDEAA